MSSWGGESGLMEAEAPSIGNIRPITNREFQLLRSFIYREAGIHLSETKRALVVGRLSKRLRELGLKTFGAYYEHLEAGDSGERVLMLDAISTNETHFFREPRHFSLLEETILPRFVREAEAGRRPKRIRIWSAACSTGEEPYSVAMVLRSFFPPASGWDLEILATDLSSRVLRAARDAEWPVGKAAEIPDVHLRQFMLRGTRSQEGKMKAGPEIRSMVRFERLNLHKDPYPTGPFDLIFCRNVLIYFSHEAKVAVVHRLLGQMARDGYFFLGHAETLSGIADHVRSVGPNVYMPSGRPKGEVRPPA